MKINIHISPSTLENSSRIFKESDSIIKKGIVEKVILLGIWNETLKKNEKLDEHKEIIRIKLIKNGYSPKNRFWKFLVLISLIQFRLILFNFFRNLKPSMVNCHHISMLPICVYGKIFFRYHLIYDIHELETEVNGLQGIRKMYLKMVERLFIGYADEVVVVGNLIGEWYRKKYRINNVHVVRNLPYMKVKDECPEKDLLQKEFKIQDGHLTFIYNGLLTSGRGIKLTLEAFSRLSSDKHIVFMGYGPMRELVKEYEKNYSNIHYKPAVAPEEIIKYTMSAHVGIITAIDTCLSYYYGLPNKLFEYIHAGIPVIVSNFPEMNIIVDQYECGWKIEPNEIALRKCINRITEHSIKEKTLHLKEAKVELCWEKESLKYEKIFEKI